MNSQEFHGPRLADCGLVKEGIHLVVLGLVLGVQVVP